MHDGLLPIGAFARAAALTVGTLRHYHEMGLLLPVRVDPGSGYRYYSAAQLVDAEVIRRLRDLNLPIEEVRRVLDARDERVTAAVVSEHQVRMTKRLQEAQRVVAELQAVVTQPLRLLADRVEERDIPDVSVLAKAAVVPLEEVGDFLGEVHGELAQAAGSAGLEPSGPGGAVYPGEDWDPTAVRITAFLPVLGGENHPLHQVLSAGRFAVAVHEGDYQNIGETYRALGVWLATQNGSASFEIRETYLTSPGDSPDPSTWRTEIAWPLS